MKKVLTNSRFLKKVGNVRPPLWIPADYKTAREKVSQTLRDSVTEMKHGHRKKFCKKSPQSRKEERHTLSPFHQQERNARNITKSATTTTASIFNDQNFAPATKKSGVFPSIQYNMGKFI